METSTDQFIQESNRGWFEPRTGWCWFEGRDEILALHPPNRWEHTFRGPLSRALSEKLQDPGKPNTELFRRLSKFPIPGLKPMLDSLSQHTPKRADKNFEFLSLDPPNQLWIEVQGSCNEQCIHCYANSAPTDLPSLPPETVSDVIEDAGKMGITFIQFTGGDPLLWPNLPEAVNHAQKLGITVEIYTNGVKLDKTLHEELIADEAPRFAFSVYSHDPETHNRITQLPGSWSRTREGLKRAVNGPGRVRVGLVIMGENSGHETKTRQYLEDLGVDPDQIRVSYIQNVGRGEEAEGASPSNKTGRNQGSATSQHSIDGKADFNQGKLCVSYRGKVIPCIFQRWMSLGSIHDRSLEEIIKQPRLEKMSTLNADNEGTKQRLACGDCRFHYTLLQHQLSNGENTTIRS